MVDIHQSRRSFDAARVVYIILWYITQGAPAQSAQIKIQAGGLMECFYDVLLVVLCR